MNKLIALLIFVSGCLFNNNISAQNDSLKILGDSIDINENYRETFFREKKWDSAIYYARKVGDLAKRQSGEISSVYALALCSALSQTYDASGDFISAYNNYKRAIDIYSKLKNYTADNNYILSMANLAILCSRIGAVTEAETYFLKAGELFNNKNDFYDYCMMRINLISVYAENGEYTKASALNTNVKKVLDTLPELPYLHYLYACFYNNSAILYTFTGNHHKALEYMKKAQQEDKLAMKSGSLPYQYLSIELNLASVYSNNGLLENALTICKAVGDSLSVQKDEFLNAELLRTKAEIYGNMHKNKAAISLMKKFITTVEKRQQLDDNYYGSLNSIGLLYCLDSQYKLADSIFKNQITRIRKAGFGNSYLLQQSYIWLCRSLICQKKYEEVSDSAIVLSALSVNTINKNFTGMTQEDQLRFSAGFDVIFDLLCTLLAKKWGIRNNALEQIFTLELQRKSLVLNNQAALLSRMRNNSDTAVANLFTAWLTTRQLLAKQYSLPTAERFLNADSLEGLGDAFEKKISAIGLTTGFKTNNEIINGLFKRDKNTAFIEFVRFNYVTNNFLADSAVYAAFVLRGGDSLPTFVPLCSEKALLKLLQDESGSPMDEDQLTKKIYAPGSKGAATLYRLVWQPVEKYLTGVTDIRYSPAGMLNNISFHALNNSKGYLVNSYTLRRFINLAGTNSSETNAGPQTASLWGNINYDTSAYANVTPGGGQASISALTASGIRPLAQSKSISKKPLQRFSDDEINPLKKIFAANDVPCSIYEQSNATEENFKNQAGAIKGVLHISTHGFYTPFDKQGANALSPGSFIAGNANPLFRCGLAFAGVNHYWMKGEPEANREDGILTGYEAAQLDLHNVQLVTLSACETGLGDITANEGNLGMQRAFKLAGAKNLLVSLWQVPAKETGELLAKFYTHWLGGNSLSNALRLAETDMQKIHPEPYYWSGFVLVE